MEFEFRFASLGELETLLRSRRITEAVIKTLSRNHNDKNQIYSGSDFRPLYPMFDVKFSLRGLSVSSKKRGDAWGKSIQEGSFQRFSWLKASGREIGARDVKMIIYAQYPETRLSGFRTVENTMPETLSVEFTKTHPEASRYLVLGRRGPGEVLGLMVLDPSDRFRAEVDALPAASGSRTWKHLRLRVSASDRLLARLSDASAQPLPGRRLDSNGLSIPFNGTQVCGYTLEHALGIVPNSNKDGDFEGIELKTHTQKKVTLFTPEPDMGVYAADFADFMTRFGYEDDDECWRLTGIHRVGERSEKSGLTLQVRNHVRGASLAASADRDVHLGLYSDEEELAAGWSLERILNCWSAKHNETVYIPATKSMSTDPRLLEEGCKYVIEFADEVLWCRETSAERLFDALYNGTLFLDPAPKYCPGKPSMNKRRSQWRVNDIAAAAKDLYTDVRQIRLSNGRARRSPPIFI